jgi:hypothetical protein
MCNVSGCEQYDYIFRRAKLGLFQLGGGLFGWKTWLPPVH